MKYATIKSVVLSLFLVAGISIGNAQTTVTVGPSGQYPTPCAAFPHLTNGETVQIDANGGVPYNDNVDCTISADNLTIVGVNGRPVMDGSGFYTSKGLWIMNGHDNVVDNIEFRNASGSENAAAIRIQVADGSETPGTTDGGNITVQHSYLHNINGTIILGANANQNGSGLNWYSTSPYITFQYDEFAYGGNQDGVGNTHNMYMGYGGNMDFTLQYSWSHDSFVGHTLKTRAPYNNVLYDMITDASGTSSYLLDFCLGGSNYVVGSSFYKGAVTNDNTSQNWFIYADQAEDNDGPEYGTNHQDLHFINNTVVDDPSNGYPGQFLSMSCSNQSNQANCAPPSAGSPAESVPAVIENNIFVGPGGNALTNQTTAYAQNNIIQTYSDSQLAADFVDWSHYDFHLASGSPAIQAGLYPPTDNTGTADPKALAKYEFVMPNSAVARPTPSGSTMDVGAYSYPRVDTPPTPSLSYSQSVTAPGTGTITISGLPTPAAGQYNYAAFLSENTAAVPNPPSADSPTGTITTTFSVQPSVTTSTQVPIDIYVMGAHLVATVTVNPGPPVLSSITQDWNYAPFTSVNLEGPAPAGGTVINLSSSDPTYLYVPSSVTVPQGQITAETGSETGSLWGQNPFAPTETITATQGSIQKSVSFGVFTPGYHNYPGPEYSSTTGGTPSLWCVVMVGYFPTGGGTIQVTSDQPSIVPNQTLTSGYGGCSGNGQGQVINFTTGVNFDGDVAVATNNVSSPTTVNVTLTLNGATATGAITVTPNIPLPPPPGTLTATTGSTNSINLAWANSGSGVTYNVFRDSSSGFTPYAANQVATGVTGTTYTDTGLVPGTPYYYVVEAVNGAGSSQASNMATATTTSAGGGSDIVAINSGGSAAAPYVADEDFASNGTITATSTAPVSTTNVVNPAPQTVYLTQRVAQNNANIIYTIPNLTAGTQYIVRLHFAETYFNSFGSRQFDIVINGTQVMTNFDIIGSAGAENIAIVEPFLATADSNGNITVSLNNDAQNWAVINGIEIQSASTTDPATSIAVVSGSGQTATVNSAFANPLVVVVDDANSKPVSGVTVTFAGTGVSFPNGATAVTNSSGQAQVTAEPTSAGPLTVSASVNGVSTPANFSETGTAQVPTAIAAVSGSGQSAPVNTPFANPLVALVTDSNSNPVSGATVTFAGSHVSFPNGATAVTGSNGEAQVIAEPTATGSLTVTASVSGVSSAASFSETGSTAPKLSSITLSGSGPGTIVHLSSAAPAGGIVVSLSSSDSTVVSAPATVTVPAGATSAATGTLLGSLWSPANSAKTATLTATYGGVTKTLTTSFYSPSLHSFACSPSTCAAVVGGTAYNLSLELSGTAPVGGATVQITSSNPAVVPNQTVSVAAGQNYPAPNPFTVNTNAVATTTTVTLTASFNGTEISLGPITVNPPAEVKSVTSDGSNSSGTTVNLTAPAPAGGVTVQISTSDSTVASVPATVTVPAGQTSVEIGTVTGSLWTPANSSKTATISATFNGITKTLSKTFYSPGVGSFACTTSPCPTVVGGNNIQATLALSHPAPVGGVTVTISSNNAAVVPTQTVTIPAGQLSPTTSPIELTTNSVTKNTSITLTASFNGTTKTLSGTTVTPPAPPASIAAVSGGGQSATTGTNFSNPLVVVVEDASNNPVNNATVTFSGSGVSFPNGATATTNASGQASVVAQPTNSGPLTISASVTGVSTPATFSETGNAPVTLSSVTQDSPYGPGTTVHLSGAAPTGGAVVSLSSSDTTVLWTPATVTVPAGQTSAEIGTQLGSWWGQSPSNKSAILTAVYNGTTQTLNANIPTSQIHGFGCNYSPCSVEGGGALSVGFQGAFSGAPVGGGSIQVTSSNTAVIPNQSYALTVGQTSASWGITTNPVSTTTTVTINIVYNGETYWAPQTVTVNP